jgi:release factor glutamine methyltransferase
LPEAATTPSLASALREATARLARAGCDTPRLDAELLLGAALGRSRERLVLDAGDPLGADAHERFEEWIARRLAREPVAYILGRKEFRRVSLAVDRRVLIPRPETELLVEVGLSLDHGARVLDVGTGSGAVALALKDERPDLEVWGSEESADALAVACANARRLELGVQFVQADLLSGLEAEGFDACLANLPYVPAGAPLPPEIARYEPGGALFAGADGLEAIRRLLPAAAQIPLAALEVGAGQAGAVAELARDTGFRSIGFLRDLAGHERVVVARR